MRQLALRNHVMVDVGLSPDGFRIGTKAAVRRNHRTLKMDLGSPARGSA